MSYPGFQPPQPAGQPQFAPSPGYASPGLGQAHPSPPLLAPGVQLRLIRPVPVGLAINMCVTASLLWMAALGTSWLVAAVGRRDLKVNDLLQGGVFHALERFDRSLAEGWAYGLFGVPTLAVVVGFCLLARSQWARVAFTLTGLAAIGVAVAWLGQLWWWYACAGVYIGIAMLLVWLPSVSRWLRA